MTDSSEGESPHPYRLTSFRVREMEGGIRLMLSRDGDIEFKYDFSHSQLMNLKKELEEATKIPDCAHPDGHAWISGRAKLNEDDLVEIISRQCRRCGYEDEF